MLLPTTVDAADLREADRVARYRFGFLAKFLAEKDLWLLAYVLIIGLGAKLLGRAPEVTWQEIAGIFTLFVGILVLRNLWISFRLRQKATRVSRDATPVEITPTGVYFSMPNGTRRVIYWHTIPDTRASERVLLIYFVPKKRTNLFRRRQYLLVPIKTLTHAERNDLLLTIPEPQRGRSVRDLLKKWRLA